jgi:hypothetical protein
MEENLTLKRILNYCPHEKKNMRRLIERQTEGNFNLGRR